VTVSREADKVKPNGKNRMNLRADGRNPRGRASCNRWHGAEAGDLGGYAAAINLP